ncbi:NAD(P)-binding protein [Laetiporus sulphureus 93-53]|uniref:NAD(P)-binding protein n=1 Tax=Laetiporus sulphureus 93-53 TaxID=1314785 RepID=A0A165H2V7_9APHY|nr:NAD(P)-binding protein [Laetiporus sulphureus 93-53]KZT11169.1 NAD(P)-binding protein [Laetiporus sulphureus 93-53]
MAPHTNPDRVWFITGTSKGLGRALLEEVLASGEKAVATLRRPEDLASLSGKYPPSQFLVLRLDVTNQHEIKEAFSQSKKQFGRLDVVVNNAGYALEGEIETVPEEEARKQMEVAFWGPVHVTKEAIPFLRDINPPGHGGRILNVSSICGYSSNPTLSYYCAAKFALEAFTESFIKEMLPEWNIKGVIIEPGGFRTEWNSSSMMRLPVHPKYDTPESPTVQFRKMTAQTLIGDPAKAAKAIMQIADLSDPPLRIQLGTECLLVVMKKALKTIKDGEKYAELAHSTNADGVDKESVLEMFKEVNS